MQRLAKKNEEKEKEKVIVSFFDKDDLDYFAQLPLELQYDIIAKVISIEIPQFFDDISRLSPVSKKFLNLCQKFVERQVLNSQNNIQLRDNLMNSRNKLLNEYEGLNDPAINSPVFDDLNVIRDKIIEKKLQLRQGMAARNRFIFGRTDNRSCKSYLRFTMPLFGVFLLPFIIYVLVRNSQCDGDNQTGNNRIHCLYAPITNFAVKVFRVDFDMTAFVMGVLLASSTGVGSIYAAAGLERFLHLLFDGIQLLVLKYQEQQELIRLATDRTTPLYEVCRQYVTTIKWEEKIFQHANDIAAVKDLEEIKTTDAYQLMHCIATLGNAYRPQLRRDLFSERVAAQNQNFEEEQPLLAPHNTVNFIV